MKACECVCVCVHVIKYTYYYNAERRDAGLCTFSGETRKKWNFRDILSRRSIYLQIPLSRVLHFGQEDKTPLALAACGRKHCRATPERLRPFATDSSPLFSRLVSAGSTRATRSSHRFRQEHHVKASELFVTPCSTRTYVIHRNT